jgi:hypothetical protein
MPFRKFEGSFSEPEFLECRSLFIGERLIIDLYECLPIGEGEIVEVEGEQLPMRPMGLSESSRIWRFTFDHPFILRRRDRVIALREPSSEIKMVSNCSYSEDSAWIEEVNFDASPRVFVPTHYLFNCVDQIIEVLGDDDPTVERIANDLNADGPDPPDL